MLFDFNYYYNGASMLANVAYGILEFAWFQKEAAIKTSHNSLPNNSKCSVLAAVRLFKRSTASVPSRTQTTKLVLNQTQKRPGITLHLSCITNE